MTWGESLQCQMVRVGVSQCPTGGWRKRQGTISSVGMHQEEAGRGGIGGVGVELVSFRTHNSKLQNRWYHLLLYSRISFFNHIFFSLSDSVGARSTQLIRWQSGVFTIFPGNCHELCLPGGRIDALRLLDTYIQQGITVLLQVQYFFTFTFWSFISSSSMIIFTIFIRSENI